MSAKSPAETDTELAHRWQEFRIRCIELAVASGATPETVIDVAERFGEYILTISQREISARKSAS